MEQSTFFLVLAIGLFFGGVVSWLIFRNEARHAYDAARGENESERAALNERLQSREEQIQQMKAAAESQALELGRLADELRAESGKRAAAEERAARVPVLERELLERDWRVDELQAASAALQAEKAELSAHIEDIRKTADEKITVLIEAQQELKKSFTAAAAESLKSNNEAFLTLARETLAQFQQGAQTDLESRQTRIEEILKPVRESLGKMDEQIRAIEKQREGAYAGLREQVAGLLETQNQLRAETGNLVKALRAPQVRGRWGEMQLERVAELAGLARNADFIIQSTVHTEDGTQRADMIVKLPGGRQVVVDAKTPFSAYLESLDAPDDSTRAEKLRQHAAQVRAHLAKLGEKRYHEQFHPTPDFVVAFLPGETFFSAALEHDPNLIEFGVEQKVVMATPTTLIALLKAVAYGWRQEKQAANAKQISNLGKELYSRLCTLGDNFSRLGLNLERAVSSYNQTVGSLEGRVFVSARRFRDLGATSDGEISAAEPVDALPRVLQAPELTQLALHAAGAGGDGFLDAADSCDGNEGFPELVSEETGSREQPAGEAIPQGPAQALENPGFESAPVAKLGEAVSETAGPAAAGTDGRASNSSPAGAESARTAPETVAAG